MPARLVKEVGPQLGLHDKEMRGLNGVKETAYGAGTVKGREEMGDPLNLQRLVSTGGRGGGNDDV